MTRPFNGEDNAVKLKIATCQFPVSRDIERNFSYVVRQVKYARQRGARLAHFSETCLGGYAGVDLPSFKNYDWDLLRRRTREVADLCRELKLWVILGSNHRLSGSHKPHNSLYVIDDRGSVIDRYDKMFCTGKSGSIPGDLDFYSPGSRLVTFEIGSIRCGLQICHDFRYQELYREYKKRGVDLVFHSYHNGGMTAAKKRDFRDVWGVMVAATMQTYAANNYMWISVNNTTRRESSGSSFVVRPDGLIGGRLPLHRTGVLISTIDSRKKFYDASEAWRGRAMRGLYHSGILVRDRRSADRTAI